jgi:hypothetical protein
MAVLIGTEAGVVDSTGQLLRAVAARHIAPGGRWLVAADAAYGPEATVPAPEGVALNCALETGGRVLIGAGEARLFELAGGALVEDEGFAGAPGRSDWYTPWGGPADVRSLTADAAGTLFVNIHVGGILRGDAGNWTPTLDIDSDIHQVVAHPDRPGVVVAATAWGLAVTFDAGETWDFRTEGMHAGYCRAVAVADDLVLVSASTGPGGRQAAAYRGPLGGDGLERCAGGLPEWFPTNVDTAGLAIDGEEVFLGVSGVVYRSADAGATWAVAVDDLPGVTCLAVT